MTKSMKTGLGIVAAGALVGVIVFFGSRNSNTKESLNAEALDTAIEDSFPASDPPSYSGAHA